MIGALGVACGAFGAHALKGQVTSDRLATWETAAHYHLIHAVVLLVLLPSPRSWPFRLITAGTVVFAGSLYALVLLDLPWLGRVTPLGGTLLLAGWISIAWGLKSPSSVPTMRP